jgi:hypothetical protein
MHRDLLVRLLMKLHATQRWNPVSRKAAQEALKQTRKLEPSLQLLANSALREELALDNGPFDDNPGWSLVGQLEAFRERLEVAVDRATEREHQLFNEMMVWLHSRSHDLQVSQPD